VIIPSVDLHKPSFQAFSSRPGDLESKDDFYILNSGLVVMETRFKKQKIFPASFKITFHFIFVKKLEQLQQEQLQLPAL